MRTVFLFLFVASRPAYMHNYIFYCILCPGEFPRLARGNEIFEKFVRHLETCSRHVQWSILFFFIPRVSNFSKVVTACAGGALF